MAWSATYGALVQESVVELHKLLPGLFGAEVPEEVGMKVTQLTGEEEEEEKKWVSCYAALKRPVQLQLLVLQQEVKSTELF